MKMIAIICSNPGPKMKMIAIICSNPGPAVVSNNAGTWAGMIMLSLLIILFVCIGIRIKDDENE